MKNFLQRVVLFFAVLAVASAPAFGYAPWSGPASGAGASLPLGLCNTTGVAWTTGASYTTGSIVVPSTAPKQTGYYYVPTANCTSGASEPAWPVGTGITVSDGGCTYTATGPTNCGGTVWVKAIDFDFTAPGSQTFSTDGSVSFGGITWTKFGSACETTHASAGGGTGLVVTPNASTCVLSLTSRTAPGLFLPLSSLGIPGLSWRTPVRAWLQIQASNGSINSGPGFAGDGSTLVLATNVNAVTTANAGFLMYAASLAQDSGQGLKPGFDHQVWQNNVATGTVGPWDLSLNATYQPSVVMLEANLGFLGVKSTYYLGWALSPWPAVQNMVVLSQTAQGISADNRIGDIGISGSNYQSVASFPGGFPFVGNAGIAIVTSRADAGAVSCTYNRLRVDYQPNVE